MVVSVLLNTTVHSVLQADIDPKRSHTHRVIETKVKIEVDNMRYHSETTEEIREIRTEGI